MNEMRNLWRLLDAVHHTLKRAARCDGNDRLEHVITAHEDARRALGFWADSRVSGLEIARQDVEEAAARLASARESRTEAHRGELINQAHMKTIAALREVENAQAKSRKEASYAGD